MTVKGKLKLAFGRAMTRTSHGLRSISMVFENAAEKFLQYAQKTAPQLKDPAAKERIAYHEAGHALLCCVLAGNGELFELNLLGDSSSGGFIGHKNTNMCDLLRNEMINVIAMILGGLAAEEIKYGGNNYAPGILHDLKSATRTAQDMVDTYGMSDLGPLSITLSKRVNFSLFFLKFAMPFTLDNGINNSENLKQKREHEISCIIQEARQRAKQTLEENWDAIEKLVKISSAKPILSGGEVRAIIKEANAQLSFTPIM